MVLGVVNLVVTHLALADISPTAFLADLFFWKWWTCIFAADLVVMGGI